MKLLLSILLGITPILTILITSTESLAQTFASTNTSNIDLNAASLNNTNCTSNRSITFNVTGVGVLSATNQLLQIDLQAITRTRLTVSVFLKAPNGTCVQIASQLGDPAHFGQINRTLDYKFRNANTCLNKAPDYQPTSSPQHFYQAGIDSRYGIFSTVSNIVSALNGVNANGTWTMYFSCTNSTYCSTGSSLPFIVSAALNFGNPLTVSPPDPNAGQSCAGAIVWNGEPLCATTAGKVSTANRPAATISGCTWMTTSENNLWVAFTPTNTNVCLNISGINYTSGTASGVQSIVVQPTNPASPCAGTWNVVNCPRDNIYASNVGSVLSQNHCFTAVPGQTYYLVIDGNAGAVTELYLTGIFGLPTLLPVGLSNYSASCTDYGSVEFLWTTESEQNNDFFTIEHSVDGEKWEKVTEIEGGGSVSTTSNYYYESRNIMQGDINYFRLSQTDYDGTKKILKVESLLNCEKINTSTIIPNPSAGKFELYIKGSNKSIQQIFVTDLSGKVIINNYSEQITGFNGTRKVEMDLRNQLDGVYFVTVVFEDGSSENKRLILQR